MFDFLRFLKRRPEVDTNTFTQPTDVVRYAIAIIAYNNYGYFKSVLDSVLIQKLNGESFAAKYDLFVFQDALQPRHQSSVQNYEAIRELTLQHLPPDHFVRQPKNIGIGRHFGLVESTLFGDKGYEFALLLEHDYELGQGYLEVLEKLRVRFANDERVSAISVQSRMFQDSFEKQEANKNDYLAMAHDWGSGVFRRTWQQRLSAMNGYYRLIDGIAFEQRNNSLIQRWMKHMGFIPGASSQDNVKACIDAALGMVRLTPGINMGKYIGVDGMHWNIELYTKAGYDKTIIWQGDFEATELSDTVYKSILLSQARARLLAPESLDRIAFAKRLEEGDKTFNFGQNEVTMSATNQDIVAAYKLFLKRFPESQDVIDLRIDQSMDTLMNAFILSDEFIQNKSNWNAVVEAAKKIIELNKRNAQASETN
jgi:hypothetical protein